MKIEALLERGSQLRTTTEITDELAVPGAQVGALRVRVERRRDRMAIERGWRWDEAFGRPTP